MARGEEWTGAQRDTLRRLWSVREDGKALPSSEIGRRMGFTKNAIVGAAHRMGLEPRPSPIKRAEGAPARKHRAAARVTEARPLADLSGPALPVIAPVAAPPVAVSEPPRPVAAPVMFRPRPSSQCCWPIGEPGDRDFRFCDGVAEPSRPYCADHVKVAYVRHVPGGAFQLGPAPGFGR